MRGKKLRDVRGKDRLGVRVLTEAIVIEQADLLFDSNGLQHHGESLRRDFNGMTIGLGFRLSGK